MYAFLLSVFGIYGMELHANPEYRDTACAEKPASVVVVVDGSSAWPGQAANKIIDQLAALLGPGFRLAVARFDAEPALQRGFSVRPRNRELVVVRPRTPLREAMEEGFLWLMDAHRPHLMIVIAHDQFYPTTLSEGRLLELARSSQTTVHAIQLSSDRSRGGASRRPVSWLKNAAACLVERVALRERSYSTRDTGRLLNGMASATGGNICIAKGEQGGIDCASSIAIGIAHSCRPRYTE